MIRADAEKIIRRLHAGALEGSPPTALARETVDLWMDALGHLDTGDVEVALREHLSTSTRWPSPAALLSLAVGERAPRTSSEERDGGCPDCRWTGWRHLRWVYRSSSACKLVERTLVATCGCDLGMQMYGAHHCASAGPQGRAELPTQHADSHAEALSRLPLVPLVGSRPGLIAWRLSGRDTTTDLGPDVETALRAQAGLAEPRAVAGVPRLEVAPMPSRQDREPARTWHERPDAETFETEEVGRWA